MVQPTQKGKVQRPVSTGNEISRAVQTATMTDVRQSLDWFFKHIKTLSNRAHRRVNKNVFKPGADPFIGGMFFFQYDPKTKDTLPYYDKFPLVIPFGIYGDGFIGLNIHYLPPGARGALLDRLAHYKTKSKSSYTYMRISYKLLLAAVSTSLFQPCIHRYLTNHIRSDVVMVQPEYWKKAALLPVQQFQKAGSRKIWRAGQQR